MQKFTGFIFSILKIKTKNSKTITILNINYKMFINLTFSEQTPFTLSSYPSSQTHLPDLLSKDLDKSGAQTILNNNKF